MCAPRGWRARDSCENRAAVRPVSREDFLLPGRPLPLANSRGAMRISRTPLQAITSYTMTEPISPGSGRTSISLGVLRCANLDIQFCLKCDEVFRCRDARPRRGVKLQDES